MRSTVTTVCLTKAPVMKIITFLYSIRVLDYLDFFSVGWVEECPNRMVVGGRIWVSMLLLITLSPEVDLVLAIQLRLGPESLLYLKVGEVGVGSGLLRLTSYDGDRTEYSKRSMELHRVSK